MGQVTLFGSTILCGLIVIILVIIYQIGWFSLSRQLNSGNPKGNTKDNPVGTDLAVITPPQTDQDSFANSVRPIIYLLHVLGISSILITLVFSLISFKISNDYLVSSIESMVSYCDTFGIKYKTVSENTDSCSLYELIRFNEMVDEYNENTASLKSIISNKLNGPIITDDLLSRVETYDHLEQIPLRDFRSGEFKDEISNAINDLFRPEVDNP